MTEFAFEIEYGDPDTARVRLEAFAESIRMGAEHLMSSGVENRTLQAELTPWLVKYALGAEAISALATHGSTQAPMTADGEAAISAVLERLKDNDRRVFGDVLEMTLTDAIMRRE